MTTPVTLVVTTQSLPGHEATVRDALLGVVRETQAETGCIQYDLHIDPAHEGRFVFYETWTSHQDWAAHDEADHIVALKAALEGKTEDSVFVWLEKIDP